MVSSAGLALAMLCLIHMLPSVPAPLLIPELAVTLVLFVWVAWGGRAGLLSVLGLWALFNAGWTINDRLIPQLAGEDVLIQGTICDFPRANRSVQRFTIEPSGQVPGLPGRIFVSWYDSTVIPAAGEHWQLKVRLKRPRGLRNPDGFDFERWTYHHRIGATGYIRQSPLNMRLSRHSSECGLTGLRQQIAVRLDRHLAGHPATGYLQALAVGIKSGLMPDDWALLRRTGTVHLMAISGLHVGLVAFLMHFFGRHVGRLLLLAGVWNSPSAVGRLCAITGAIIYAGLAGFSVPTVRAMMTVVVVTMLLTLRRSVSVWSILASALLAVLMVDPASPLSIGFWMSFYAVGLLSIQSLQVTPSDAVGHRRITRILGRVRGLLAVQILLAVGLGPLSILFFDQVSMIAPLCNLIVVPIFALIIVPLTLSGTALLWVSDPLAGLALGIAAEGTAFALGVLTWLDRLPLTVWHAPRIDGMALFVLILAAMMLVWPRPVPGRWPVLSLLLALVALLTVPVRPDLRVVVMDVGQGLAVLIQTPGHALLFDTGPAYRTRDAGHSVILPAFGAFDVRRLDAIVVSHGDADHRGGVETVLAAFPDAEVIAPGRVDILGKDHLACEAGMRWTWEDVEFRFLHPNSDQQNAGWSENDESCVLLVQSVHGDVLLPGDIERRAEKYLTGKNMISAVDLVIAPHHGSKSSSSERFVAATRPRFVVFSTGHRNRWGFPAEQVSARWRGIGAITMTTADSGAVVFESDGSARLALRRRERPDGRRIWTEMGD